VLAKIHARTILLTLFLPYGMWSKQMTQSCLSSGTNAIAKLPIAKAGDQMVIDNAAGLQKRIADG
jgi:hypothetical protein